jgi:steroid delta-isomerase-like uncharacterized protein
LTPDQAERITRQHAELWSRQDAEAVAALYAEDCVYEDAPGGSTMRGKEELIAHARGMFRMISGMTVNLLAVMATETHSAREYVITGTWAANGKPVSLPGVSILEFDGDFITRNTDYYDFSTLMNQVAD